LHATLFFPIYSISNYGFFVTALNFFKIASFSAKVFLSYYLNLSKNPISFITFLAPSQSPFSPSNMHTASKTITTAGGGEAKPLI